ncbi:hypothetical protein ACLA_006790 [Neofusicoccum parvum]|nr:hypothetical protein ACLA_006790 [Neofusicoccum parvum]
MPSPGGSCCAGFYTLGRHPHEFRIDEEHGRHSACFDIYAHGNESAADDQSALRYARCRYPYRAKFVCAQPGCRRSIKPVYDPSRFEHRFGDRGEWRVRPLRRGEDPRRERAVLDMLARATGETRACWSRRERRRVAGRRFAELDGEVGRGLDCGRLTKEEFRDYRASCPKYVGDLLEWDFSSRKRCPSCGGDAVPVGSNFRIPGKRDEKGWKRAERMLKEGVRFSFCPTVEDYEKMMEKLQPIIEEEKKEEERIRLMQLWMWEIDALVRNLTPEWEEEKSRREKPGTSKAFEEIQDR